MVCEVFKAVLSSETPPSWTKLAATTPTPKLADTDPMTSTAESDMD